MSMPSFPPIDPSYTREAVMHQILASIAMEEVSLSHIINAEGEKLQYALGTIPGVTGPPEPASVCDLLKLNESVRRTLEGTMQNQIFLNAKLQNVLKTYSETQEKCIFRSSYLEAVGSTQTVGNDEDVTFDTAEDIIDIVGTGITVDTEGKVFTIREAGLYHVEWSANIASQTPPFAMGILEKGYPVSAIGHAGDSGNCSSGALIHVSEEDLPFTLQLHNFGGSVTLTDSVPFENTAVSIRILRFAEGPSV